MYIETGYAGYTLYRLDGNGILFANDVDEMIIIKTPNPCVGAAASRPGRSEMLIVKMTIKERNPRACVMDASI